MKHDKQIQILFIDSQAEIGGGEVFLVETLKHIDKKKFGPSAVLGAKGPLEAELEKIFVKTMLIRFPGSMEKIKRDPSKKSSVLSMAKIAIEYPRLFSKFNAMLKKNSIDLLVANTVKSAFIAIPVAIKHKKKVVWILHDNLSQEFYKKWLLMAIKLVANSRAANIVCVSETVRRNYLALTRQNAAVVYNGVDLKKFSPAVCGKGIRKALSLQGKKVVSLIGRLEHWKGQKVFIKAAKQVLQKNKKVVFLVVGGALFGEHEFEKECKTLAEKLGVKGNVLFLGERRDIPRIIAASDIIVHASTRPEPFGRDVIEAMACGKPVISTNGGGPKEIISPGAGILIEPNSPAELAEQISLLLQNPRKMMLLGKTARKRVEKMFDIRKTTKQLEKILLETLKRGCNEDSDSA